MQSEFRHLVTVCVLTYNHELYIQKALDSLLAQQTDFDFKVLVADDCSKDGTRAILQEYKAAYPDKIELLLQEKNIGPYKNWTDLVTAPKSKYIAYLEGDDFWLDNRRLTNQIQLLENSEASYCGAISQVFKNGQATEMYFGDYQNLPNGGLLESYRFFRLSTLIIQTDLLHKVISDFSVKIILNEYTINNVLFEIGKGIYYKEIVSAYNVTGQGTWSGLSSYKRMHWHYTLVRSMRQNLTKNWSFFALQELVTFPILSFYELKYNRRMKIFFSNFLSSLGLMIYFVLCLGFITSIPQAWHWIQQRRKTGIGV
jgi:glycosyltransferase involved in cell wall biosynthesis